VIQRKEKLKKNFAQVKFVKEKTFFDHGV